MRSTPLKKVAREIRSYALSLPEATEDFPWGERVMKVKGKVFVFLGKLDTSFGLSAKLPKSAPSALRLPFTEPTGYGLGKSGWVSASFRRGDDVPVDLLKRWIQESYRAVAPKSLARQVAGDDEPKPPRRRSAG